MAENYCKKFFELPTIPVQDITTEELAVRLYYMYMCMRGQMQEMHAAVKAVAPDHKFSPDLEAALVGVAENGEDPCCCESPDRKGCPPWCLAC